MCNTEWKNNVVAKAKQEDRQKERKQDTQKERTKQHTDRQEERHTYTKGGRKKIDRNKGRPHKVNT